MQIRLNKGGHKFSLLNNFFTYTEYLPKKIKSDKGGPLYRKNTENHVKAET